MLSRFILTLTAGLILAASCIGAGRPSEVTPTATIQPTLVGDPATETPLAATTTPEPTATSTPEPTATPVPVVYECCVLATRYGESYNGLPFGCYDLERGVPVGYYSSSNTSILAAPPSRYSQWPCGTQIELCSQVACLNVVRVDSCPGCGDNHVDLSESGIAVLCGSTCDIIFNVNWRILTDVPSVLDGTLVDQGTPICRFEEVIREQRCK